MPVRTCRSGQLDLAWPSGLQEGLSQPVCVLLHEPAETLEAANDQGFRYFTSEADFRAYVEREVLGSGGGGCGGVRCLASESCTTERGCRYHRGTGGGRV